MGDKPKSRCGSNRACEKVNNFRSMYLDSYESVKVKTFVK